jgi:hypothetical protein
MGSFPATSPLQTATTRFAGALQQAISQRKITAFGSGIRTEQNWLPFALPWVAVLAGVPDMSEAEWLDYDLRQGAGGDGERWHTAVGVLGPLACAAGMTLAEATASRDNLDPFRLQMMASLRGYPTIPILLGAHP